MTYRSEALISAVRQLPCMVDYPHVCNEYDGVGPMHSNWEIWGKGKGLTAPDDAIAAGCNNAHMIIDPSLGAKLPSDEREMIWLKAHIKTIRYMLVHGYLTVNKRAKAA